MDRDTAADLVRRRSAWGAHGAGLDRPPSAADLLLRLGTATARHGQRGRGWPRNGCPTWRGSGPEPRSGQRSPHRRPVTATRASPAWASCSPPRRRPPLRSRTTSVEDTVCRYVRKSGGRGDRTGYRAARRGAAHGSHARRHWLRRPGRRLRGMACSSACTSPRASGDWSIELLAWAQVHATCAIPSGRSCQTGAGVPSSGRWPSSAGSTSTPGSTPLNCPSAM